MPGRFSQQIPHLLSDSDMPNWKEILEEIQTEAKKGSPNALDIVRRKYILEIHKKTGRNVIAYYLGWLQRGNAKNHWKTVFNSS